MIRIVVARNGRVDCKAMIDVDLSARQAWGQLRNFHRFAKQEYFHHRVEIESEIPRQGAGLRLSHRFCGIRVKRIGRICRWREEEGFAFSDLSKRGPRAGFPHVFGYRIEPISQSRCKIHLRVAGLWTAGWLPRWMRWVWLFWVMQFSVRSVENELLMYLVWRKKKLGNARKV